MFVLAHRSDDGYLVAVIDTATVIVIVIVIAVLIHPPQILCKVNVIIINTVK